MLELNTIHLGDSYKLIKNIPDKSIDLIYTDIPYLYDFGGAGGNSRVAKNKARNKKEIKHLSNGIDYAYTFGVKQILFLQIQHG